MIKAIYNAVVVKPLELEETQYGSIIVPDLGKETNKTAQVVGIGPGHYSSTGTLIPTQLQVGDIVVLPTMGFTKFEYDSEEYFVGKENEILAVIEKQDNE